MIQSKPISVNHGYVWYNRNMHTFIILLHVSMMIISLVLMSAALGMGVFGKKSAAVVATISEVATVIGALSGTVLLLGAPLSVQCALLTMYVIAMTSIYWFGFAMGNADEARFIRSAE